MSEKTRVAVGLSGGVDSTVAALLLKNAGYDVTGVTMKIWSDAIPRPEITNGKHACFHPDEDEEIEDASDFAQKLGIPYKVYDLSSEYEKIVLSYFSGEYAAGRTPNPCVVCNCTMKFGKLLTLAIENLGKDSLFATGHYVRSRFDEATGRYQLLMAANRKKDQSYFLYKLRQDQLARCLFPLGELTKEAVRELAAEAGLHFDEIPESQNFFPGDYTVLIDKPFGPGNFVLRDGTVLGTHRGIPYYTIGQRKGLGIAWTEPLFVVEIRSEDNTVVLGSKDDLYSAGLEAEQVNWVSAQYQPGDRFTCTAKIRSQHSGDSAEVEVTADGKLRVFFDTDQLSVTPGQSVVCYVDDVLICGGEIIKSLPATERNRKNLS